MATNKQKALAKKIVENPRLTMKDAMLEVGYSEATASHPTDVTKSVAWPELMEKYLPDSEILDAHQRGLRATKPIGALVLIKNGADGKPQQILKDNEGMIEVEDIPTQLKAVELAYKIKGKLKDGGNINISGDKVLVIPSDLIKKYGIQTTETNK